MKWYRRMIILCLATIIRILAGWSKVCHREGCSYSGQAFLKFFPGLLPTLAECFQNRILVTGTNGKTTTTGILTELLSSFGYKVLVNSYECNQSVGVLSAILRSDLQLKRDYSADFAVFEVDEAAVIELVPLFKPHLLLITNLGSNQANRFGDGELFHQLTDLLKTVPCKIVLNGNDPGLVRIGSLLPHDRLVYFGMKSKFPFSVDAVTFKGNGAWWAGTETPELFLWAELIETDYLRGSRFFLRNGETAVEVKVKLPGIFNIMNIVAATTAYTVLTGGLTRPLLHVLEGMETSLGRYERFRYQGLGVLLFLVKNPVGFNYVMHRLLQTEKPKRILFILNDLLSDGMDVSWIWDADLENLRKVNSIREIVVCGTRAGDMALRIKYSNLPGLSVTVDHSPRRAFRELIRRTTEGEDIYILANHSALVKFRAILTAGDNKTGMTGRVNKQL